MRDKNIDKILRLMSEEMPYQGSTINMTGARYAQEAENFGNAAMDVPSENGLDDLQGVNEPPHMDVNPRYTDKDIKIGRRYIELMGGHERARDLLDKIVQSDQLFGLGEEEQDAAYIDQIASATPEMPDYPVDYSSSFNPSSY